MDKCIYRVPLTFDAPLNERWKGFINPYLKDFVLCTHCQGLGSSKEARALERIWFGAEVPKHDPQTNLIDFGTIECEYGFIYHFTRPAHHHRSVMYLQMMQPQYEAYCAIQERQGKPAQSWGEFLQKSTRSREVFDRINSAWMYLLDGDDVRALEQAGALRMFTHTWSLDGWIRKSPTVHLTPDIVNASMYGSSGHGLFNEWIAIEALCKRQRLNYACPYCQGQGGQYPSVRLERAVKAWRPQQPPKGTGYQLWVPGDEGAPISPVFEKAIGLLEWMETQGIRFPRSIDRKHCLAFIRKGLHLEAVLPTLIWLWRDYRINLQPKFHPTLLHTPEYLATTPFNQ